MKVSGVNDFQWQTELQRKRCQWQIELASLHKVIINLIFLPLILTVGEFGPADCFLHPLQFWHRLSASEMKEHRESSSNLSESSKENLSPSSHSANISSMTLTCNSPPTSTDSNSKSLLRCSPPTKTKHKQPRRSTKKWVRHSLLGEGRSLETKTQLGEATARPSFRSEHNLNYGNVQISTKATWEDIRFVKL